MPMFAPTFVDPSEDVILQSENGVLGLGPYPLKGMEDPDPINAGKEIVTLCQVPRAAAMKNPLAWFDLAEST